MEHALSMTPCSASSLLDDSTKTRSELVSQAILVAATRETHGPSANPTTSIDAVEMA